MGGVSAPSGRHLTPRPTSNQTLGSKPQPPTSYLEPNPRCQTPTSYVLPQTKPLAPNPHPRPTFPAASTSHVRTAASGCGGCAGIMWFRRIWCTGEPADQLAGCLG